MLPRETTLSDQTIANNRLNNRKKLMEKVINDEQDCFTKLKLRIRKFFMWLYNIG
jgi:hypothetical protein